MKGKWRNCSPVLDITLEMRGQLEAPATFVLQKIFPVPTV